VTFYDEGLGAEHKREWWRWAYDLPSRATGLGISQNIKDCYTALIEYYEPGDRVFLFGFSRGAFTVRSLGGVLSLCGIPQRDATGNSPRDRQNKKGRLACIGLKGCSSHSGRRTFVMRAARLVHKAGGSLRDVQLLAGHRSIQTTQRYIDGDSDAQRKLVSLI
jgi:integrase